MGNPFKSSITKDGAFFRVNPGKVFRDNVRDMMAAIAAEGEHDVVGTLRSGQGGRLPLGGGIMPGRVSAHVHGRTMSLTGRQWSSTAVVSVNNRGLSRKQGIKLMAAASYLEGTVHAFRRTTGRVRRAKAALLKGLQ